MKIVIDARLYGLENAGLGRYIINLVDNLISLDHENEYVLLLRGKYFKSLKLPKNWTKELVEARHYSLKEQFVIPMVLKKLKADLVHFPHFNVPLMFRGKFVVTIHDILMHKQKGKDSTTLPWYKYGIKRVGYKKVFKHAAIMASKIIVPSKFAKSELLGKYDIDEKKFIVTYEGVNLDVFKSVASGLAKKKYGVDGEYFIYTGNAYPHKNLERVIEALRELNKNRTEKINLVVVTSRGIFAQRLHEMSLKGGVGDNVKIVGFVPDGDLASLYKGSVGFLYATVYEGFGLPGLEAMASGTLVLASEIEVFREVYGKMPLYFNPYDFTSIKRTMEMALEMSLAQRREKVAVAKEFVKRYSWKKMAQETLEVYGGAVK